MTWEIVSALLLGAAVLWLVLSPLVRPGTVHNLGLEPEEPLETRRGQSLAALKELDFDREMGKLSDADYASLRAAYTAEALAALREDPSGDAGAVDDAGVARGVAAASDPAEALIAARAQSRQAGACRGCGAPLRTDGQFCDQCGAAVPV